jgi:TonB family protein
LELPTVKRPVFNPAKPALAGMSVQRVRPVEPPPVQPLKVPIASTVAFSVPPPKTPPSLFLPVPNETTAPARRIEEANFATAQVSESKSARKEIQTGAFSDTAAAQDHGRGGRRLVASGSGFEGTAAGPPSNGSAKRAVQTSGFGSPESPEPAVKAQSRAMQAAGFGQTVDSAAPARAAERMKVEPPEILSKPRPLYTAEARAARIEGDVVIKVNLKSNGDIQIIEIVKGLGHGLDQAAYKAAEQIRFRPARKDGVAVDFTTTLRIVFELG